MTEMKARLVDKDGNPLGTAANPLKISDHSISTATWGSITGTLSDQTDLNTTLIAKASSTTAALSILVYDGTPSAGDLTTYDEIYTTPALCFAALPAIIDHAVTITMRKADGSAYAAATLQRVVAGGSITIRGEYYWNNTIASAGSGAGKFNVNAADTGVQAGDKVFLMKYTGTVDASTPSDSFIDTVASVDGTEVTLTDRTSDAFDTSWTYVIVRTEIGGRLSVNYTNAVTITGLCGLTSLYASYCYNVGISKCIIDTVDAEAIRFTGVRNTYLYTFEKIGINQNNTGTSCYPLRLLDSTAAVSSFYIRSNSKYGTGRGFFAVRGGDGLSSAKFGFIRGVGNGTNTGIAVTNGGQLFTGFINMDGYSSAYKMTYGILATNGAQVINSDITFGSNITTEKSPANWAATTDGSYIS